MTHIMQAIITIKCNGLSAACKDFKNDDRNVKIIPNYSNTESVSFTGLFMNK